MTALTSFIVDILFVSVCLRNTVGHSSNDDLQQKFDIVVNEVGDLRETMNQMREDMKEMKKISKALNNLCAELQLTGSATDPVVQEKEPGINIGDGNTQENQDQDNENGKKEHKADEKGVELTTGPFQIHSFDVINGTYKVEYDPGVTGVNVYTESETLGPNVTSYEPGKLISAEKGVITGPMTTGTNLVSIMAGEFEASVTFQSNNQTPSKIDFEPLELNSNVRGSVIFEPGQSQEVKITLRNDDSNNVDVGLYTPFKNGTVIIATKNNPEMVNVSIKQEDPKVKDVSVTINGDNRDHEGLLYLSLTSVQSDFNGLTYMFYSVSQLLQVRRADHKDPFEVGYIGFVKYEFRDFDETCRVGKTCVVRTSLVGNRPQDVTLWRKLEGKKTQLKVSKHPGEFGKYILSVIFYLPNPSTEDEGRYIYLGTSHNGTEIEREFYLTVLN